MSRKRGKKYNALNDFSLVLNLKCDVSWPFSKEQTCLMYPFWKFLDKNAPRARRSGSEVEPAILAETQAVREVVRIPGSNIRLVYHSGRAKGFYSTIQLQLTPASVPESLVRVHLHISIEGKRERRCTTPWRVGGGGEGHTALIDIVTTRIQMP